MGLPWALGAWILSHTAARHGSLELCWVHTEEDPLEVPERADLLNDDALPKGSSAGQLTDLAWCGQQDVPLRAEWGSSSPWNATLLAPCPGQLLPFPSKCLPLHLGIQATVSKTAPYKAVRCKMVACHVPLNN